MELVARQYDSMASGELEVLRCESSLWSGHCCARCRAELGRIINRGANCRACRERICMSCREYSTATHAPEWLCIRCHKEKIESLEPAKEWIVDFWTPENMKYPKNETKLGRSLTFKVSSFSTRVRNALCVFLSTDSSPWSAVRGSPELRAYSSMPRGSIPWPQRNGSGGGGVGAAIRIGRSAQVVAGPTNPDDRPAQRQPAVEVNTVHLVDTCGHIIDMQTVSESTRTAIADPSTLKTLGDVDHPGSDESEDFRRKQVATALTRVQEDLKHIPPGVTPPRSRRFLRRDPFLHEDILGGNRTKDDYRLVFLNGADWSSDDGGCGRQTSSSLSADDDCDWDYFMAGLDDDNDQTRPPEQTQQQQQRQSAGGAGTCSNGDQLTGCSGGSSGGSKPSETDARATTTTSTTFVPVVLPFPVFVPVPIVIPPERAHYTLTTAFANVLTEYFRERDAVSGTEVKNVNDQRGAGGVVVKMPEPPAAAVDEGGGAVLTMYATRPSTLDAKSSSSPLASCGDEDRDGEVGYYSSSSSPSPSPSDDSDDSDAQNIAMSYDVNDSPDDDDDEDEDDGCNVKLSSILDSASTAAVKSTTGNSSASDEFSGTESMEQISVDESSAAAGLSGKFTSLIMITRDDKPAVNVVTSDTTKIMPTVFQDEGFKLTLDTSEPADDSEVKVVTGGDTLSAVIALEEGMADDDSWVEDLDRDDFKIESSEGEEMSFEEEPEFRRSALDFTLHTIVEESCEESEVESDRNNQTELEKYFFFGLCDKDQDAGRNTDAFSETSSIMSEGFESLDSIEPQPAVSEIAGSRLERYFLSEFMGFDRPDSDGSVGSDSPEHSPEQRRKRLVRARGTGRQHSSLDNLTESEQQVEIQLDYEDSSTSSDSNEESVSFEKNDGQFDTVKRGKKKKRSVVTAPPLEALETEETAENIKTGDDVLDKNPDSADVSEEKVTVPITENDQKPNVTEGLTRTDSFNYWSSDEETNLMMSKMRAFFKTMLANQPKPEVPGEKSKPPQLVKFESELTRLMKTVPGIRDEQVKEIVEYLSSEDTWSDSYDSSDYTSSDLETGSRLQDENRDTAFVYQKLMASLRKIEVPSSDSSASRNSPPLVTKVMQHIGSRLVALMHAVSENPGTPRASRYHRRSHHHHKTSIISTTTEEEDEGDDEQFNSPLPRSKSHDPLLEEARQEASDNERFSWRGSFESTLMMSDSRTRLTSSGESCVTLAAKRRSAGDLLIKSANSSREQLDRVRSCGSIGGSVEDRIWRNGRRRSSVPDSGDSGGDSDDGAVATDPKSTTLPRSLQQQAIVSSSNTNSLPRLPTTAAAAPAPSPSPLTGIYKAHSVHQFNVKSARYRPPGYKNVASPPRREYNRRRITQHPGQQQSASTSPSPSSSSMANYNFQSPPTAAALKFKLFRPVDEKK
ncbi:Synaptotagmin-like protein 5 [Aphis craccivora]|uniref:Synaptotagmin-like protein 5 n=1 Tax=Aphis craccivora TaxID=307492 RepID=A0A6G0Z0D4_APHCR|nr:Synaptotagmin-like protein 5 [Aphis craccivora]